LIQGAYCLAAKFLMLTAWVLGVWQLAKDDWQPGRELVCALQANSGAFVDLMHHLSFKIFIVIRYQIYL